MCSCSARRIRASSLPPHETQWPPSLGDFSHGRWELSRAEAGSMQVQISEEDLSSGGNSVTNTEDEKAQAGAVWGLVPQSSGRWGVPNLEEPCGSEQLMTETNMEAVAVTRPGDGGRAAKWPAKDRGGGMFGAEGLQREQRGKSGKASSLDPREQTYTWLERQEWMWLQPWDRAASPLRLQRAGFPAASPACTQPAARTRRTPTRWLSSLPAARVCFITTLSSRL